MTEMASLMMCMVIMSEPEMKISRIPMDMEHMWREFLE